MGICQRIHSTFVYFVDTAHTLNPYVTQFRYPGGPLEPELAEAKEALRLASELVEFVRQRAFPQHHSAMMTGWCRVLKGLEDRLTTMFDVR